MLAPYCDGTVHQYCFHLYDQSNSSNVLPSLDELSYLFRLTLVLTHKLANGITLSANIMSIVLLINTVVVNKDRLHDFQGSNALCAATRDTNQYVAGDEGYESIRCSTPTTGRNCLHLAPCHSMASSRSCLLSCPSSRSCLLSCRANCIPIMTTVHADCCIFSRPLDSYAAALSRHPHTVNPLLATALFVGRCIVGRCIVGRCIIGLVASSWRGS